MTAPNRGAIAALVALTFVSLAIKILYFKPLVEPSVDHLVPRLLQALAAEGYQARRSSGVGWNKSMVIATKGPCTIRLSDMTRLGGDLASVASERLNDGRPIRYVRHGQYIAAYPSIAIEIEWRIQREFARLGSDYPIAPIIAVGAAQDCWPNPAVLAKVEFRLR